ncbi:MFS transporter [Pseudorhodoplanes sinuspersici]|uniref:MFS transporter n=1 Tax=Pseudorhodoplanes sinuspersici TaxID=1235591 RepID=UPI001FD8E766|nr:MFS transporter [Pseudorhodoplanes sinuspersici]
MFCVADVQTGFGPFVAVYLASQKWTQIDIGLILTTGSLVGLLGQIPGGMLVDRARSERLVAGLAILAIATSAVIYASFPFFAAILLAAVVHAMASCVLGPCIAAISLGLVGHTTIAERLGRNARFASIGNGLAAATMGTVGYFFSPQAVFVVTAMLAAPTVLALSQISAAEIIPDRAHGGTTGTPQKQSISFRQLLQHRSLLALGFCLVLFHLANAALLPLMGTVVTTRSSQWATVLIGACIVVPQIIVAAIAPSVGAHSRTWGRRTLLLIGVGALPIRAVLFAIVHDPYLIVAVQILDGLTAAIIGVIVPLVVADLTRGSGRFNTGLGMIGTMSGIGASFSPTLAGLIADHLGTTIAFLSLGMIGAMALTAVWLLIPETRSENLK